MYIGPWQEYALSRLRSSNRGSGSEAKGEGPESPRSQAAGVADLEAIKSHLEQNLKSKLRPDELKQLVDTLSPLVQQTPIQRVYDVKSSRPTSSSSYRNFSSGPSSVNSNRSSFSPMPSASFRKPPARYRLEPNATIKSGSGGPLTSSSLPDRFFEEGRGPPATNRSIDSTQSTPTGRRSRGQLYDKARLGSRSSRGSYMSTQSEPVRADGQTPTRTRNGVRRPRPNASPSPGQARSVTDGITTGRTNRNRPPMDPHRTEHDRERSSYDGAAAARVLKVARRQQRELIKPDFKSMWKWAKDGEDDTSKLVINTKKKKKKKKKSKGAKPKEVAAIEKMKKAWLQPEKESKPTVISQEKVEQVLKKMDRAEPTPLQEQQDQSSEADSEEESSEEEEMDPIVKDMALTNDQLQMVAKYFGGMSELATLQQPQLESIQESSFDGGQTVDSQSKTQASQPPTSSLPISIKADGQSKRIMSSNLDDERNKGSSSPASVPSSPPLSPFFASQNMSADDLVNWTKNLDIEGLDLDGII